MGKKVTPALIREQALQLHGLDIGDARCAELARAVDDHNSAIRNAAWRLDFNDEPARFSTVLAQHAQPRKKRR